jgi:hypothetical protein
VLFFLHRSTDVSLRESGSCSQIAFATARTGFKAVLAIAMPVKAAHFFELFI